MQLDPPFADPGIRDGERTTFRGTIAGTESGTGTLTIEAADGSYVARLDATILEHYRQTVDLSFERTNGTLRAASYRAESRNGEQMVSVEEGWFRGVRGLHWGGELLAYPSNVTPLVGCAVALRGLDFTKGERHSFALWLANSVWWEIALHVDKRERIELPTGPMDAWRVTAAPQFEGIGTALNRIVQAVLPPFRLHFDADPSHRLVRFSFPTGPFPWNPRGLIEAVELS